MGIRANDTMGMAWMLSILAVVISFTVPWKYLFAQLKIGRPKQRNWRHHIDLFD